MGTESTSQKDPRVSHPYFIHTPPERTFDAFTNPRMLVKWLSNRPGVASKKTGEYRLGWTGGSTHARKVLELEPGKSIGLAREWPGVSRSATVLRPPVEPKDDGSLLTVEHTDFPRVEEWTGLHGGAEPGWTYLATNLKSALETGLGPRSEHDGRAVSWGRKR